MAAVAGQKRRQADDSFPIPSARKRQAKVLDWASLPPDIAVTIAELLLAEDVVDYMCFRAVCASWRASTPSPRDPTLRDARFRPRRWVALCDGDGIRPADAGEIAFFNTRTGRGLRVRLPDIQCHSHRIVGFTDDGLLILFHMTSSALRVVHPFTGVSLDLPPLAPIFWSFVNDMYSIAWMNAAVCSSAAHTSTSIAVVIWFPNARGVICAEPGHRWWTVIHKRLQLGTALSFEGKLFGVTIRSRTLVQVYPPPSTRSHKYVVAQRIPVGFNNDPRVVCYFHLVAVKGQALVVVRLPHNDDGRPYTFTLFAIDTSTGKLTQVKSLGDDCVLLIGRDRCISVSAKDLPSLCGDSIYMSNPTRTRGPTILHILSSGTFERMSICSFTSHLGVQKLHSVRPFTLVDQLLTYCNHTEWSKGFMFHEYHANAAALGGDFLMKLCAQDDKEIRIPPLSKQDEVGMFKDYLRRRRGKHTGSLDKQV
ncbi:hypothetical protein EJB05_34971, partial [Eragrostis curvula]